MKRLEEARKIIDRVDGEMAKLFAERMKAVAMVAEAKKDLGLQIFDPAREEEVIRRNSARVEDEGLKSYYINFLQSNMEISRAYQSRLLDGMRVAYSGVNGAFGQIAAHRIFPDATLVSFPDFLSAYDAVEQGDCDCAVLPMENSYAGDVTQVVDRAYEGSLYINGIYDLEIVQNLLAVPGTSMSDIKEVISHPQALSQCAEYLREKGFKTTSATNTAVAACRVAESGRHDIAAVASLETARLYGLQVMEKRINESSNNTTRFAVFSRVENRPLGDENHFIMFFTVKNEAGSLGKAVSVIGQNGFNLRALKSRPTKNANWEYYFYVEGEGALSSDRGRKMLEELKANCAAIKVVGAYDREKLLKEEEV
ncbi:MAG: chorismate mutase [Clostridia bacterium]|nr:chorismate mutase [Clostridia bacterium]